MGDVLQWIEQHPGMAAWVQAVGTILAVSVAVAIPWRQQRDAALQAGLFCQPTVNGAMQTMVRVWSCLDSKDNDESEALLVKLLSETVQALSDLPTDKFPPAISLQLFSFVHYLGMASSLFAGLSERPEMVGILRTCLVQARLTMRGLRRAVPTICDRSSLFITNSIQNQKGRHR